MIDIEKWMTTLTDKLKDTFGDRLLFVGLQGSYRRGEAHEGSDIDAVIIFDALSLDDLKVYRRILSAMPNRDMACGFVGDKQALQGWPRHELFQFKMDTRSLHGNLDDLLPEITREDIIDSVRIGASGIYHACCHSFLHNGAYADSLKAFYKGAFFILQAVYYLRSGEYVGSKRELMPRLEGAEQDIISLSMDWNAHQEHVLAGPDTYVEKLITWCAAVMNAEY